MMNIPDKREVKIEKTLANATRLSVLHRTPHCMVIKTCEYKLINCHQAEQDYLTIHFKMF